MYFCIPVEFPGTMNQTGSCGLGGGGGGVKYKPGFEFKLVIFRKTQTRVQCKWVFISYRLFQRFLINRLKSVDYKVYYFKWE